ncbi:hypothetical protein BURC_02720 [Burkholderiaceae bacterium]|nr:hypothetical protein BURC_02720 [Burkholderiaceae bacterium]
MRQLSRVSLRDLLYIVFRDKNRIVLIVLLSLLGAGVWLSFQDSIYVAESRVLVRVGKEKLAGIETMVKDNYNILFQERGQDIHNGLEILKDNRMSYAVLERLKPHMQPAPPPQGWFKRLKYELKAAVGSVKSWAMQPLYWLGFKTELSPEEQAARALKGSLQVEAIEDTDVIRIGFAWPDPQFAALAVNTFTDEFLAQYIRIHENPQSEEFYRDQIAMNQKQLTEAEAALSRFRQSNNISNISLQKEILLRETSEAETRLNEVSLRLEENRLLRDNVAQTLKNGSDWIQTPETRQRAAIDLSALDRQYFELVARRSQLAASMADGAPEMQQIAQRMAQLRQSKGQNLIAILTQNMNAAAQEKALLDALWRDKRSRLAVLDQRTAELGDLERLRGIAETTYLSYKKKAEELRVSDLLSTQKITGVRVISEARAPVEPAAPRRGLILALAAFIGLFLGIGYSAVAEYFNHTFRNADDVERMLGARLLMTVPKVQGSAA